MKYNALGDSGVKVSAITFGAWAIGGWMWGGADKKDALEAIDTALDLGISTIDTAPIYGFGLSEELVGEALQGKRHQAQILTKYGMRWEGNQGQFGFKSQFNDGTPVDIYKYAGKESVIKACEESLRRLRTDYIDLYQIHWPDSTTPIEETMEAVAQLLQEGKIRASGVCNYSAEQMKIAEKVVRQVTNQVPYSMVERHIEEEVTPYCVATGKGILAYSPLQRGLLTGKITDDYRFEKDDHRPNTSFFKTENRRRINAMLDKLRPMAQQYEATLAQVVINWTLQQPAIVAALVGARNARQVRENAKALDFMLSPEEIGQINGLLNELKLTT